MMVGGNRRTVLCETQCDVGSDHVPSHTHTLTPLCVKRLFRTLELRRA